MTTIYVVVSVPLQLAFALVLALALDRGLRGLSFYRSIFYLPSLLGGSVAIAILWRKIFGVDGLVNAVLALFGIEGPGWVSDPDTALGTLILLHVWTFGAPMVIFLAGLRQIPQSFYEAASVDGAGKLRQFRSITLPLLTPIIFFNLVLEVIKSFQSFTQSFIVSGGNGGPVDSTLFYTLYLYLKGFKSYEMGYAAAMAWVLLLIIAGLTGVNFLTSQYLGLLWRHEVSAVPVLFRPVPRRAAWLKHLLLIGFGLVMLYPLLWMVSSSLKPEELIFREPGLWPSAFTLENYTEGWTALKHSFGYYLWNSAVITVPGGGGEPGGLLAGRLRLRPAGLPAEEALVRRHARLDHAAVPRDGRAAVHRVLQARLDQHDLAADRAEVPGHRRVLHLPDGAVHPHAAPGAGRGGGDRRRGLLADLHPGDPAAVHARRWPRPAIFTFIWTWNDFFSQNLYLTNSDNLTVAVALRAVPGLQRRLLLGAACSRCRSSHSARSSASSWPARNT